MCNSMSIVLMSSKSLLDHQSNTSKHAIWWLRHRQDYRRLSELISWFLILSIYFNRAQVNYVSWHFWKMSWRLTSSFQTLKGLQEKLLFSSNLFTLPCLTVKLYKSIALVSLIKLGGRRETGVGRILQGWRRWDLHAHQTPSTPTKPRPLKTLLRALLKTHHPAHRVLLKTIKRRIENLPQTKPSQACIQSLLRQILTVPCKKDTPPYRATRENVPKQKIFCCFKQFKLVPLIQNSLAHPRPHKMCLRFSLFFSPHILSCCASYSNNLLGVRKASQGQKNNSADRD